MYLSSPKFLNLQYNKLFLFNNAGNLAAA